MLFSGSSWNGGTLNHRSGETFLALNREVKKEKKQRGKEVQGQGSIYLQREKERSRGALVPDGSQAGDSAVFLPLGSETQQGYPYIFSVLPPGHSEVNSNESHYMQKRVQRQDNECVPLFPRGSVGSYIMLKQQCYKTSN